MLSSTSTGLPALTSAPAGTRRGDHQRRGRGAQHAALIPADPVGDPVHLDHVHRAVDGGSEPVGAPVYRQPAQVRIQPLKRGVEGDVLRPPPSAMRTR